MDVVSAALWDDTIAWHENRGDGGFTERIITTTADGAVGVFAADIDGDGDIDVLSASFYDNSTSPLGAAPRTPRPPSVLNRNRAKVTPANA